MEARKKEREKERGKEKERERKKERKTAVNCRELQKNIRKN